MWWGLWLNNPPCWWHKMYFETGLAFKREGLLSRVISAQECTQELLPYVNVWKDNQCYISQQKEYLNICKSYFERSQVIEFLHNVFNGAVKTYVLQFYKKLILYLTISWFKIWLNSSTNNQSFYTASLLNICLYFLVIFEQMSVYIVHAP